MYSNFFNMILSPIKAMKWRYVPLLMIFFAYGSATFSGIAESFFIKERLHLSAEDLMMIGVWLTVPWTIKMVFGQLADSVPIFGSTRRSYIYIAAVFMALGSLLLAGLAANWTWVTRLGSPEAIFIVSSLLSVTGAAVQNVVADAMSVEVVPRSGRTLDDINHELTMVQLLTRMALNIAIFLVAGLGGWLAHVYSYQTIFLLALIIPIISISGVLFIDFPEPEIKPVNKVILIGGILYAIFVTLMCFSQFRFKEEITLIVSLIIVVFFMFRLTEDLDRSTLHKIICAAIVIFIFRAMPSVGPALQWWEIDVLKFNPAFFGTLAQISAGLTIVGMWVFAKFITQRPIGLVFIALTIVGFFLSLPMLAMYYGFHNWTQQYFGFGAHAIAIVDVALASPFAQLSMVPMLALIARYAPKGNVATWFAIMASLMNLALMAGGVISRDLNHIWVVTREIKNATGQIVVPADYRYLGNLLWVCIMAGLVLPVLSVLIFLRGDLRSKVIHRGVRHRN